jgi:hypothetical protein
LQALAVSLKFLFGLSVITLLMQVVTPSLDVVPLST